MNTSIECGLFTYEQDVTEEFEYMTYKDIVLTRDIGEYKCGDKFDYAILNSDRGN